MITRIVWKIGWLHLPNLPLERQTRLNILSYNDTCTTNFPLETGFKNFHFNCYLFQLTNKKHFSYAFKSHLYPLIYVCKHMLVSHIFHTAQTDQYPRTYPLILTYSYISRRWDKWNEVFQGEEISRFIHKHLPFSTVILKRWHHRSKRIFTNVIIHFGRTFLTPLKQCHKHCSTHKPVIVITNVLFNGMRDYAFIQTEHYVQI